jgi:UDP-N-acetylmuramate--alanine ligase
VIGVFQPHLFTRTRDFVDEFAEVLSTLDEVALLPIYPAREEPIPGVTSDLIFDNLRSGIKKQLCTKSTIMDSIREKDFDVLVTLGAGDIENFADEISDFLTK